MRLLVVTHYFAEHGGGVEIIAEELARRLARRGLDVRWAASGPAVVGQESGVARLPLSAWNWTEDRWGVPYPVWGPAGLRALWEEVRRCDLVHLHDSLYAGNVAAFLAARRFGKPVLVTQHIGLVPYRRWLPRTLMKAANRALARRVLRNSQQAVFYSEQVRAYFAQQVRFRRSPAFIPNGVDDVLFHPVGTRERLHLRARLGLPADRPVLLFVGRFVEKKGLPHLRDLATRFPQCEWVLVGWGPINPADWGLENVRCVGPVGHDRIARYYQAADLLVLPSVGEGFPLVVQEAMACGTPVLLSAETAMAVPGVHGVTFTSELDAESLAHAVGHALDTPDVLRSKAEAGLAYACKHWNWEVSVDQYYRLMTELFG